MIRDIIKVALIYFKSQIQSIDHMKTSIAQLLKLFLSVLLTNIFQNTCSLKMLSIFMMPSIKIYMIYYY